jgi:CubicO group peptidase (beta-lactamase class C family)
MKIFDFQYFYSIVLIAGCCTGCLVDDELNLPFDSYTPAELSDGLIISSPADENMDPVILEEIYKSVYTDDNLWSLRSLLVFKNGRLVSEAYLKDKGDISTRYLIWSCTKQVIGILTGIAVNNGLITDIDDSISSYFDVELDDHPDKGSITIRNLITMQSGIDWENDGIGEETDKMLRQIPDNSVEFILNCPINADQGTVFNYNDGNPHLMSALIQKITGKATDEWADEVFFSKIDFDNFNWVRYKDGITLGGFGIETTPREMAKIALCIADNGKWNGLQVIDSVWIHQMVFPHTKSLDWGYSFGYFWWIDTSRAIYFMWGHGGQFAFIVPGKKLVIVMTSIPNTQGDYQISADEALLVVDKIIEATF